MNWIGAVIVGLTFFALGVLGHLLMIGLIQVLFGLSFWKAFGAWVLINVVANMLKK